jgi:hypothetical protein
VSVATLLKAQLATNTAIAAIVSARIYPVKLPEHPTLEAISYQRVSNTEQKGTSTLRDSRWQINCWADHYSEAHTLAAAVKTALEEWHDLDQTPGVNMARIANELDDYEDDVKTFRVILDVILTTTGDCLQRLPMNQL